MQDFPNFIPLLCLLAKFSCSSHAFDTSAYGGFPLGCFYRNFSTVAISIIEPADNFARYKNDTFGLRAKCRAMCVGKKSLLHYLSLFAVDISPAHNQPYCHCIHPAYEEFLLSHHVTDHFLCSQRCPSRNEKDCEVLPVWLVLSLCPVGNYGANFNCRFECPSFCAKAPYPMPSLSLCKFDGTCTFGCENGHEKFCEESYVSHNKLFLPSKTDAVPQTLANKITAPHRVILVSSESAQEAGEIARITIDSHSTGSLVLVVFRNNSTKLEIVTLTELHNIEIGLNNFWAKDLSWSGFSNVQKDDFLGFAYLSDDFKSVTEVSNNTVLTYSVNNTTGKSWGIMNMWGDELLKFNKTICPEALCKVAKQVGTLSLSLKVYVHSVCSPNCDYQGCEVKTGACHSCLAGWKGVYCRDPCEKGTFGSNCEMTCSSCYMLDCDPVTGKCQQCNPGYLGSDCLQRCPAGTWGLRCQQKCGFCLDGTPCDVTTGFCFNGCEHSYELPFCATERMCPEGRYGEHCRLNCGFCNNGKCDKFTGNCTDSCMDYFYGPLCSKPCGACANLESCDPKSGKCPNGCAPFYQGPRCLLSLTCSKGFYGENCQKKCAHCMEDICNLRSGACTHGCQPEYLSPLCMKQNVSALAKKCRRGYYGDKCELVCGNCKDKVCDRVGDCTFGCDGPFYIPECRASCGNQAYGINCLYKCGHCYNNSCSVDNGTCIQGCKEGWKGDKCNITQSVSDYWSNYLSYWTLWN